MITGVSKYFGLSEMKVSMLPLSLNHTILSFLVVMQYPLAPSLALSSLQCMSSGSSAAEDDKLAVESEICDQMATDILARQHNFDKIWVPFYDIHKATFGKTLEKFSMSRIFACSRRIMHKLVGIS